MDSQDGGVIRIMTYNVHRCLGTDRRLSVERIAEVVASMKPDIVALQELDVGRERSQGSDQPGEIARLLDMQMHFHPAYSVLDEHFGDAILTSLPNRLVKRAALPAPVKWPKLERRGALWAMVKAGSAELQVINTHLGLRSVERMLQVDALLGPEWLGDPGCTDPVLLIGDFNSVPRSGAYRRLKGRLTDVAAGLGRAPTFPSRFPLLRLDHIFFSGDITVHSVRTLRNALTAVASDHLPLVADIEVRAAAKSPGIAP